MPNVLKFPVALRNVEQQYELFDDFFDDQSDLFWVDTVTDTGTALVGDAVNGVMVLTPSDGTVVDNDETYLATANELFLFAADKPMIAAARVKITETTANVPNVFFGFANAIAADTLVDNGGGMRASGSLAAIYKVDGGTAWKCTTRSNSVVTDSTSSAAVTAGSWLKLEIEVIPKNSTQVSVVFRIDGIQLKDTAGNPIVHTVTVASATEMQLGFGIKLGAATNNDTLSIDWVSAAQQRT